MLENLEEENPHVDRNGRQSIWKHKEKGDLDKLMEANQKHSHALIENRQILYNIVIDGSRLQNVLQIGKQQIQDFAASLLHADNKHTLPG